MHRAALTLFFASIGATAAIGLGACASYETRGTAVDPHARGITRPPGAEKPDETAEDATPPDEVAAADAGDAPGDAAAGEEAAARPTPTAAADGRAITMLRRGEGAVCGADSLVLLRYEGRVEGGSVFDRSEGDEPAGPWPVSGLIPGLRDSLIGLAAGSRCRVVIPPDLAYGDAPVVDEESGEEIVPANATLVYTVELVEVIDRDGGESADG